MQIVLSPRYEYLRPWIETIPAIFPQTGTVIYDARNQIRVIEHNGLTVNAKRFHCPALPNRLVYSAFRMPKAVRAYQNAERLLSMGVPTPEPIAYILCGKPLLAESYLLTVQSPLSRNFYEFRYHSVAGYESLIRQFACFTADLHRKGILHKDYSPGNILFDVAADGKAQFSLVDINRMEFDREIDMPAACRNFCRLWGHRDFIDLLGTEYARARGWDEAEVRRLVTRYWEQFWHIRTDADIARIFSR